jgi:hypothetical protein
MWKSNKKVVLGMVRLESVQLIHLKQIYNQRWKKKRFNKPKEELACKTLCANISHYVCVKEGII